MGIFTNTDEATVPSSQSETVVRYEGRELDELDCVRILWAKGILFSGNPGRARRESPLPYLKRGEKVPSNLKFVVLTGQVAPGNKLWGRIDFLVNHCGYQLLDERK